MLTERILRLREESHNARVRLTAERAELLTDFYKENEGKYSVPVLRALAFKTICERKTIYIGKEELIVGERGPAPKAVPTYPEIACNSLEDFRLLALQERIPYEADEDCLKKYEEKIIPYWRGRSLRDRMFNQLSEEWQNAYEAGLFTEFMEQRAPGTPSLDETIYYIGLKGMQEKIREAIEKLDFLNDPDATDKREELKAMLIGCDAVILFAERHAVLAEQMAKEERNENRKVELKTIADNCRRVPANAPETLWQALQMYWFLHVGIITEINGWDACNPGHVDRNFYPFYRHDIDTGIITKDFAKELLCAWWIKFNNQPAPAKYGVTAQESGSYNDFVNINLGGVDRDGNDAVNELSYLFLDIMDEIHLIQPQANLQLSEKNPDTFLKAACRVIRKGYGYPSIFSAENTIAEQLYCGKSLKDARDGGTNGCVETTCHGKEAAIDTGYLNVPKLLELTLHNGYDPRAKKQLGPKTGKITDFNTFDDFFQAFRKQTEHMVNIKIAGNQYIEQMWAQNIPVPFLSVLINDCISKGKDYNAGGPRYNNDYIMCVGLGTISDCLSAICYHIYDKKDISWERLLKALDDNFTQDPILRQILLNKTPRYGNDNEYADKLMERISDMLIETIDARPNSKGGQYHAVMLPTTCHIYFGSVTGATPDGRLANTPLSEGISAVQGATVSGPTAAMKSAAHLKHDKVCGALLNMKLTPDLVKDEYGIEKMAQLVRGYFKLGANHVQFNIVNKDRLLQAQKNPEQYKDLIVRVAGYSDYFCVLGKDLQDEIIHRTEHISF